MESPTASFRAHPDTHIGPLHLIVSDLTRSLRFYQEIIGFRLLMQEGNTAALTVDGERPLLLLTALPNARPRPRRTSGLFHFAILMPDRLQLAYSLRRLAEVRWPMGASDHLVSEALYLSDPDGNGIELYRDRPRAEWSYQDGQIVMDTLPLNLQAILDELDGEEAEWPGLDSRTVIGHMHLNVGHLAQAERFYRGALGLDLMTYYGESAAFLSAEGYHHHLGLNTWNGVGAPPPMPDAVGLRRYTWLVPDVAEINRLAIHLGTSGIKFAQQGDALLLHDPSANAFAVLPYTTNLLHSLWALDMTV